MIHVYYAHNTGRPTTADVEAAVSSDSALCPEGHVPSSPGLVPELMETAVHETSDTGLDPRQRDRKSL